MKISTYIQYSLRRINTDSLDCINHPSVNFISELIEIDIFISYILIQFAEHVDSVLGQHTGQLDIQTAFTNSQRYLFRFKEHLGFFLFLVQTDRRNLSRAQGALNKQ